MGSDVKFHEIFCHEIFHEIFLKYLKKIHDVFSGFTLTRLTFLYAKHYLSFIYAYCSSTSLSAGLLNCLACFFKSFHTIDIEIGLFCRTKDYALYAVRRLYYV